MDSISPLCHPDIEILAPDASFKTMISKANFSTIKASVHSIIVKITLEQDPETSITTWHGQVNQVTESEKRSVRSLVELAFVTSRYLEAWGVRSGPVLRLGRWIYTTVFKRKL